MSTIVILSTRMVQLTSIGKLLQKRNIFVLIDLAMPAMQNQQILQQQQLIILNRPITIRNLGQVNNSLNQRCPIHLNICKVQ